MEIKDEEYRSRKLKNKRKEDRENKVEERKAYITIIGLFKMASETNMNSLEER